MPNKITVKPTPQLCQTSVYQVTFDTGAYTGKVRKVVALNIATLVKYATERFYATKILKIELLTEDTWAPDLNSL